MHVLIIYKAIAYLIYLSCGSVFLFISWLLFYKKSILPVVNIFTEGKLKVQ